MEKETEKCCGECCWFCFEETGGWGQCMQMDVCDSMHCSDLCTTDEYISREEMRHYMAVLLQATRFCKDPTLYYMPKSNDIIEAQAFAYKFMKVFSKL